MKKVGRLVGPRLTPLNQLASFLNKIPLLDRRTAKVWRKAEGIITAWRAGSRQQALHDFKAWAAKNPVALIIQPPVGAPVGSNELSLGISGPDVERIGVYFLAKLYFERLDRDRLKQCPQCQKWFADKTRRGNMVRCSTSCTNKWWTLDRRRQAARNAQRATQGAKRRAKP